MTTPTLEEQVAAVLPCDGCCIGPPGIHADYEACVAYLRPAILTLIRTLLREERERCAELVESWPLSVANMQTAEVYAKHGWANAVAGVLNAKVCYAIRNLGDCE